MTTIAQNMTTEELENIVAEQHGATLTGGHRPEDAHPADGKVKVEDLHPEICAPAIKDSPKHARQTRLQIVRKDAKGNVVSEADVAAKAAVAVAARVATEKVAKTPKVVAPKAAKTPKAPKPEKVAKVAEPVLGRWHGVTFTLQMVLDVHADARNGMSLDDINAKYGLDITDILKRKAWFVQRAAKVAKACGITDYVFPEAFLKPGRAAKKVVTPVAETPSQVVPSQDSTPAVVEK